MDNLMLIEDKDGSVLVQPRNCPFCGKKHEPIRLGKPEFERWTRGEVIQKVWPNMSSDQREILISGACPECYNKFMGDE